MFVLNFGLLERFTSEKETEGIQDRVQMQAATAGYLSDSNLTNILFGNGFNNIGVVNDSVGDIESFDDNLRVTGPHNSYLFFILKYGFIGLLLYISIFYKFIKIATANNIKNLFTNNIFLYIGAYLILGLASDILHNHTVVWLMYYFLYEIYE